MDESFDYVIVGGGTAGCILAARLSEDPLRRVLLLEAGGVNRSPWIKILAGFIMLMRGSTYNWRFETVGREHVESPYCCATRQGARRLFADQRDDLCPRT